MTAHRDAFRELGELDIVRPADRRPAALRRELAESLLTALERSSAGEDALARWTREHAAELGLAVECPVRTRPDGSTVLACTRDCPCEGTGRYVRDLDWAALLRDAASALYLSPAPSHGPVTAPGPAPAAAPATPVGARWPAAADPFADLHFPRPPEHSVNVPRRRFWRRRPKYARRVYDAGPSWLERLLAVSLVAAALALGWYFLQHYT